MTLTYTNLTSKVIVRSHIRHHTQHYTAHSVSYPQLYMGNDYQQLQQECSMAHKDFGTTV